MPRMRSIKHEVFMDEFFTANSFPARELFHALLTIADREGRLINSAKHIKTYCLPHDDVDIEALLQELATPRLPFRPGGFIQHYTVNGVPYIYIRWFLKHQKPHHREPMSTIPAPPDDGLNDVTSTIVGNEYINDSPVQAVPLPSPGLAQAVPLPSPVVNGEWRMENGEWNVESGEPTNHETPESNLQEDEPDLSHPILGSVVDAGRPATSNPLPQVAKALGIAGNRTYEETLLAVINASPGIDHLLQAQQCREKMDRDGVSAPRRANYYRSWITYEVERAKRKQSSGRDAPDPRAAPPVTPSGSADFDRFRQRVANMTQWGGRNSDYIGLGDLVLVEDDPSGPLTVRCPRPLSKYKRQLVDDVATRKFIEVGVRREVRILWTEEAVAS